jgi:hypothetical protein
MDESNASYYISNERKKNNGNQKLFNKKKMKLIINGGYCKLNKT